MIPSKYINDGGKIENQYNSSFCSAFSTTSYLTALFGKVYNRAIEFSPLFAMRNSKQVDGTNSKGTYLSDLLDEIVRIGCCELDLYHESLDKDWLDNKFPSVPNNVYENARKYKPIKKVKLKKKSVEAIKKLIYNNAGCLFALNCFSNYTNKYDNMFIREPNPKATSTIGRHAIYVCGYDNYMEKEYDGKKYKGFFILQESYGSNGRSKGFVYMPYEFITRDVGGLYSVDRLVDDVYYLELNKSDIKYPRFHDKNSLPNIEKQSILWIDKKVAIVDGIEHKLPYPPTIINGRTLVPFRFLFETVFGAGVYFDAQNKSIRAFSSDPNYVIRMSVSSKVVTKEAYGIKQEFTSEVPPTIINGNTLIPLRLISEIMGCKVDFDSKEKKITITE